MKWRVRKIETRERRLHWWHNWFAWYPVRVPSKGRLSGMTKVWLQTIEGMFYAKQTNIGDYLNGK